jgi:hypothetical protein
MMVGLVGRVRIVAAIATTTCGQAASALAVRCPLWAVHLAILVLTFVANLKVLAKNTKQMIFSIKA